jgi:phosphate transport system permease protein
MNIRSRVEEAAPNVVLFTLAISVVLVTAGIVFVLFSSASKFYSGFACGADVYNPPQDWSQDLKDRIGDNRIYAEGELTDPFYLNSYCVIDWELNGTVQLAEPLIVFNASLDEITGTPIQDSNGDPIGNWTLNNERNGRDRDTNVITNQYLIRWFEQNPENTPYDDNFTGTWQDAHIPLWVIKTNESSLILHERDDVLDRGWIEIMWIGNVTANGNDTMPGDVDGDGIPNDQIDPSGAGFTDKDIDGDSIDNFRDTDMDGDGIPNDVDPDPQNPSRDNYGISMGIITLLILLGAYFCHLWLPRIEIALIDQVTSPIRVIGGIIMTISAISVIVPPSALILIISGIIALLLTVVIYVLDRKLSLTSISASSVLILLGVTSIHTFQTGQLLMLGASILVIGSVMTDSRNQVGDSGKLAHFSGDMASLATLAIILTMTLLFFDNVARVEGSIGEFLTQTYWKTDVRGQVSVVTVDNTVHLGVNSLLQTTLQVALGALIVAIPLGLGTAVYLAEYAHPKMANLIKPILELLAGIPSVVYGFFAFIVISPIVVEVGEQFLEWGWIAEPPQAFNPLNGAIVVGVMITPLIASLSEDALRAVPNGLRQASYALGATETETTGRVTLPSALSGILASIILALSRAIGETMAVTLSVGAVATFSDNMFLSAQTMTAYIAQRVQGELPSGTTPYFSLFAVGLYLFVITLGLNIIGHRIMTRFREEYE